jgi:hypothetical protein
MLHADAAPVLLCFFGFHAVLPCRRETGSAAGGRSSSLPRHATLHSATGADGSGVGGGVSGRRSLSLALNGHRAFRHKGRATRRSLKKNKNSDLSGGDAGYAARLVARQEEEGGRNHVDVAAPGGNTAPVLGLMPCLVDAAVCACPWESQTSPGQVGVPCGLWGRLSALFLCALKRSKITGPAICMLNLNAKQ